MARASIVAFLLVVPMIAHAADQTVLGTQLLVRDPATPEHRKIVVKAREVASDDSIVGDPVASGAMLTVTAEGATSTTMLTGAARRRPRRTSRRTVLWC